MNKIIINSVRKIFNIEKNLSFSIFLLTFFGALTQTINIILVGPLALTFFNPDLILQMEIIAQLNIPKRKHLKIQTVNRFFLLILMIGILEQPFNKKLIYYQHLILFII